MENQLKGRVSNVVSLLTSDALQRMITFIIYVLIARYLGSFEFGQLSLTLAIFYLLQSLAPTGLKILVTRDVARETSKIDQYLVNGSLVALISSLIVLGLLLLFLKVMQYSQATVNIILFFSLGLIPFSLMTICEAVFQALEKMHYGVVANVPMQLARGFIAYLLLSNQGDMYDIGILFFTTTLATLIIEWALILWRITCPTIRLDMNFIIKMIRPAMTFVGLQTIIAITSSIIPILLSKLSGEADTGLYNAATQLMTPVVLFCQSVVMGLFPAMCQRYDIGKQSLRDISEHIIESLYIFTIPAAVGLYFLAEPILIFLYRNPEFIKAVGVVRVTAVCLVIKGVTSVLGRVLLASRREHTLLCILIFELIAHLGMVFYLVRLNGLKGAALAMLLTTGLELFLHLAAIRRVFTKFHLISTIWKPFLASIAMAGILIVAKGNHLNILLIILGGGVFYLVIWMIITVILIGNVKQLRTDILRLWSE